MKKTLPSLTALTLSTTLLAMPVWAQHGGHPNAGGSMQGDCTLYDGTSPTDAEATSIVFMMEEEQMARDLYLDFNDQYQLPIFDNISVAEQTHMDAIACLIDKYGLTDPSTAVRESFFHPELQDLYDELLATGMLSVTDAVATGALVEETDIADLLAAIAQLADDAVENPDIEQVYDNLMRGSRNHLRSFVRVLGNYGVAYEPTILTEQDYPGLYAEIVSGEMERANGPGNGGRAAGNGNAGDGIRGRRF